MNSAKTAATTQHGKDIIVIGSEGYVGSRIFKQFEKWAVKCDTKLRKKPKDIKYKCAFICVPTPSNPDGSCDKEAAEKAANEWDADVYIVKSTITPPSNYKGPLVFSPEYFGSSSVEPALDDADKQPFVILGGRKEDTKKAVEIYQRVRNANLKIFTCTYFEAILIKYMENCAIANKVTFCNEFYNICKAFEEDYNTVREGFLMDPRMSRYFTFVYPDKRGFGGHCLPKDLSAIIEASKKQGYYPEFLKEIERCNARHKDVQVV